MDAVRTERASPGHDAARGAAGTDDLGQIEEPDLRRRRGRDARQHRFVEVTDAGRVVGAQLGRDPLLVDAGRGQPHDACARRRQGVRHRSVLAHEEVVELRFADRREARRAGKPPVLGVGEAAQHDDDVGSDLGEQPRPRADGGPAPLVLVADPEGLQVARGDDPAALHGAVPHDRAPVLRGPLVEAEGE